MTFKELKTGYPIYLLNKENKIEARQGKVVSVSSARIPNYSSPFQLPTTTTTQLVVDVTIEDGGAQKTYTIPELLDVTYAGSNLVISVSKEGIIREVEAIKAKADDIIASVKQQEAIRTDCEKLLADWNPVYKEKQANEERFGKLENQIGEINSLVKNLIKKLS